MEIEQGEHGLIELRHVYNPIVLKTDDGEEIAICMRDGGFEVTYNKEVISINRGEIKKLKGEADEF